MSAIGKRTIYVGPADGANHKPLNVEGVAVAATAPGTLLSQSSSGLSTTTPAATVFGVQTLVADKDQQRSKSVDTAWTINENLVSIAPRSGEFLNVLVVTGQDLEVGTAMTRTTAGLLTIAATDGTVEIICHSDEDVTTSGTTLVRMKF